MQINRFVNGEKTQKIPEKIENAAVKEAVREAERRLRALQNE